MRSNQEILDLFGKSIIEGFDSQFGSLQQVLNGEARRFIRLEQYVELFDRFNEEEKKSIENYFFSLLSGLLHDSLRIFEEREEFKLIYQENGKKVNLVEISEMLKAEPIIENGWIERFSEYGKPNLE